jgi:hypothetical protein
MREVSGSFISMRMKMRGRMAGEMTKINYRNIKELNPGGSIKNAVYGGGYIIKMA